MKKGKQKFGLLMLFALVVCLSITFAACGKGADKGKDKPELENFPATASETVELGSTYNLRESVVDKNKKTYKVSATVKTKLGADVAIISGGFFVSVIDGYTVTYTAKISDNDIRTSIVTINVQDTSSPSVTIAAAPVGFIGKPYTLPEITFKPNTSSTINTDTIAIEVNLVSGTELIKQNLTNTEGVYTFTPNAAGVYRIKASAKDNADREGFSNKEFRIVSLINEVFDASAVGAQTQLESRRSYADDVVWTQVKPGDEKHDGTGAYTGAYITMTMKNGEAIPTCTINESVPHWATVFLLSSGISFPIDYYADYDYVSIWYYIETETTTNATTGVLNQFNNGAEASGNWYQVVVPREAFFSRFTAQYLFAPNNGALNNAKNGITEVRIGSVTAYKNPKLTVSATENPREHDGKTLLTVGTERADGQVAKIDSVSVYSVAAPETAIAPESSDGNVFTFELPYGNYNYKVTPNASSEYLLATAKGSNQFTVNTEVEGGPFAVHGENIIKTPETGIGPYIVGDTVTIPNEVKAVSYDTKEDVGTATIKSIHYIEAVNPGVKIAIEKENATYKPIASGKLYVTYEYEKAADVTLEITVNPKRDEKTTIASGKDVLLDFVLKDGANEKKTVLSWHDNGYMYWNNGTSGSSWVYLNIADDRLTALNTAKTGYGFLRVKMWFDAPGYTGTTNGLFFKDTYTFVNNATRQPVNQWVDVYIPVTGAAYANSFFSIAFNQGAAETSNYPGVKEVRFAEFEFVNAVELGTSQLKTYAAPDANDATINFNENESVYIKVDPAIADKAFIVEFFNSSGVKKGTSTFANGVAVWSDYSNMTIDRYTARLYAPTGLALARDGKYVSYITTEFLVGSDYIVLPNITETYTVGDTVTIPTGVKAYAITDDSESGTATVKAVWYIEAARNERINLSASVENYKPTASGKLYITYSYSGAADVTLEIPVSAEYAANKAVLSGKDALLSFRQTTPAWVNTDGEYVRHSFTGTWNDLHFSNDAAAHINNVKGNFGYLYVRVYAESDRAKDWNAPFFNSLTITGAPVNQWFDVYIPVGKINTGTWFMTAKNNVSDVSYPFIRAIRLAGFEFVTDKTADVTLTLVQSTAGNTTFESSEDVKFSFTAGTTPAAADYKLEIRADNTKIDELSYDSEVGGFKWTATNRTGRSYTAVLVAPVGYHAEKSLTFSVTNTATVVGQVFNPENHDALDKLKLNIASDVANHFSTFHVPAAANNDPAYGGAYVGFARVSTNWTRFDITPTGNAASYAGYDYISTWVYLKSYDNRKSDVQLSFYNDGQCKETFKTDTWVEIRLDAKVFAAKLGANTSMRFFDINYFGTMGVVEVRFGAIVAENAPTGQNALYDAGVDEHFLTNRIGSNGGTSVTATRVLAADNEDVTYGNAYTKFTRSNDGDTKFILRTPYQLSYYSAYDTVSMWVYFGTVAGTPTSVTVNMYGLSECAETFNSDTWVKIELSAEQFVTNMGKKDDARLLFSFPFGATYNELRIGTITGSVTAP